MCVCERVREGVCECEGGGYKWFNQIVSFH